MGEAHLHLVAVGQAHVQFPEGGLLPTLHDDALHTVVAHGVGQWSVGVEDFYVLRADVGGHAGVGGGLGRGFQQQPVPVEHQRVGPHFHHAGVEQVADAHDFGRLAAGRPAEDLLDGTHLFHAPLADDGQPVAHGKGVLQAVGDVDNRQAQLPLQPPHVPLEPLASGQVERREGFIQQQHAGLGGQGARDGHSLLLAPGNLVGIPVGQVVNAHVYQQFQGPPSGVGAAPEGVGHVFQHGHVGKESIVLEDVAHAPPAGW